MIYKISVPSDPYVKVHLTDNFLLAQLVQKDFNERFGDAVIGDHEQDWVFLDFHDLGTPSYCKFEKPFEIKFSISAWPKFKSHWNDTWEKAFKEKNRNYFKIYAFNHVVCLTLSQKRMINWELVSKSDEFDHLYNKHVG